MLDGIYSITSLADLPSSLLLDDQPGQNVTVNIDWMSPLATFGVNNGDVIVNNGTQIISYFDTFVGKTPGSVGTLEFSGVGTRWDLYDLDIGRACQGELTITGGAVVSGRDTYLAYESSSVATVNVTGAGSLWEVEYLSIADQGQATVNISSGGEVRNSGPTYVGFSHTGSGVVNVSGTGSKLVSDRWTTIGLDGDGELHISGGGQVTTGEVAHVASSSDHLGTVTVSDPNSQWNIGDILLLGDAGQGSLSITNGGVVTSGEAFIGNNPNPALETQVVIDGADSRWSVSGDLYLGDGGRAVATVSNGGLLEATGDFVLNAFDDGSYIQLNGGTINARSFLANESDLQGSGTVNAEAWALNGNWTVAQMADLPTQLLLDQSPGQNITVNLNWTGAGPLGSNDDVLTITNGSALTAAWAFAGYTSGSIGVVNVSGIGNTWNSGSSFSVGNYGRGTFNLTDGATTISGFPSIASKSGSTGIVNVTGTGTAWTTTGWLDFGRGGGQSEMHVAEGGTVQSELSAFWGSQSLVTVAGPDSSWSVSATLTLRNGGAIEVTDGASLSAETGTVGDNSNADASVTVDGAGSQWMISGMLQVARNGNGTIHVANGGSISVGDTLWLKSGSTVGATLADTADPLIDVAGNATLAGELNIALASGFALQPGQEFTLIDVVGTRSGLFSGLAQNSVVASFGGANLIISYSGGDGNDVVLMSMGLSGDYDYNGLVNGADFLLWQRGASPDPYSTADLQYWAANFGNPTALQSYAATVPEPTAEVLAAIAMTVLVRRRRS